MVLDDMVNDGITADSTTYTVVIEKVYVNLTKLKKQRDFGTMLYGLQGFMIILFMQQF